MGFMSEYEKNQLRLQCYVDWRNNLNGDQLVDKLYGQNLISDDAKSELDIIQIPSHKNDKLFVKHLLKFTHEQMYEMIELLQDVNKTLAERISKIIGPQGNSNGTKESVASGSSSSGPSHSSSNPKPAAPAGGRGSGKGDGNDDYTPVEHYLTKNPTTDGLGKSVCVIIDNFADDDLVGYRYDRENIKEFFKENLNADVLTEIGGAELRNLNKKEFEECLEDIRKYIQLRSIYDRFYFFLLSHGTDEGILMYDHGIVTQEKIIKEFSHDKMSSMKDYPKFFFFQACRGAELAKVAHPGQNMNKLSLDADILIAYSTTPGYLCFVPDGGSWFIKNVIDVFGKHFSSNEDIVVQLREVKRKLSETLGRFNLCEKENNYIIEADVGQEGVVKHRKKDGSFTEIEEAKGKVKSLYRDGKEVKYIVANARQFPTVTDQLRRKFCFTLPKKLYF